MGPPIGYQTNEVGSLPDAHNQSMTWVLQREKEFNVMCKAREQMAHEPQNLSPCV